MCMYSFDKKNFTIVRSFVPSANPYFDRVSPNVRMALSLALISSSLFGSSLLVGNATAATSEEIGQISLNFIEN